MVFLLLVANASYSQTTVVSGIVMDAGTKDPIPFASVYFKEGKGVTADSTGHFEMRTNRVDLPGSASIAVPYRRSRNCRPNTGDKLRSSIACAGFVCFIPLFGGRRYNPET